MEETTRRRVEDRRTRTRTSYRKVDAIVCRAKSRSFLEKSRKKKKKNDKNIAKHQTAFFES